MSHSPIDRQWAGIIPRYQLECLLYTLVEFNVHIRDLISLLEKLARISRPSDRFLY